MGDDWNRAVMGDPKKAALLRAFGRTYKPDLSATPSVARLLAETFALSAGEHNFGVFYRGGGPWTGYSNHVSPISWEEQRNMINVSAFSILADVDPAASSALQAEVARLAPVLPDTSGMVLRYDTATDGACTGDTLAPKGAPFGGAGWQVALNCSGAVVALNQTAAATSVAADTAAAAAAASGGGAGGAGAGAGPAVLATLANPLAYLVVPGEPTPLIQRVWTDTHTGAVIASVITNATKSGARASAHGLALCATPCR